METIDNNPTQKVLSQIEIEAIFKLVTDKLLKKLKNNPIVTSLAGRNIPALGATEFPNPTTWDINNGLCDQWAEKVEELLPDAIADWEEINDNDHCSIYYNGKVFDAECWEGVTTAKQLPIHKNSKRTRLQVLTERKEKSVRL